MKELLEYIIKAIVEDPHQVTIEEKEDNGVVELSLKVAPQDMGKVIGKEGKIIKAIRKILTVRAFKEGKRVYFKLLEEVSPPKPAPQ